MVQPLVAHGHPDSLGSVVHHEELMVAVRRTADVVVASAHGPLNSQHPDGGGLDGTQTDTPSHDQERPTHQPDDHPPPPPPPTSTSPLQLAATKVVQARTEQLMRRQQQHQHQPHQAHQSHSSPSSPRSDSSPLPPAGSCVPSRSLGTKKRKASDELQQHEEKVDRGAGGGGRRCHDDESDSDSDDSEGRVESTAEQDEDAPADERRNSFEAEEPLAAAAAAPTPGGSAAVAGPTLLSRQSRVRRAPPSFEVPCWKRPTVKMRKDSALASASSACEGAPDVRRSRKRKRHERDSRETPINFEQASPDEDDRASPSASRSSSGDHTGGSGSVAGTAASGAGSDGPPARFQCPCCIATFAVSSRRTIRKHVLQCAVAAHPEWVQKDYDGLVVALSGVVGRDALKGFAFRKHKEKRNVLDIPFKDRWHCPHEAKGCPVFFAASSTGSKKRHLRHCSHRAAPIRFTPDQMVLRKQAQQAQDVRYRLEHGLELRVPRERKENAANAHARSISSATAATTTASAASEESNQPQQKKKSKSDRTRPAKQLPKKAEREEALVAARLAAATARPQAATHSAPRASSIYPASSEDGPDDSRRKKQKVVASPRTKPAPAAAAPAGGAGVAKKEHKSTSAVQKHQKATKVKKEPKMKQENSPPHPSSRQRKAALHLHRSTAHDEVIEIGSTSSSSASSSSEDDEDEGAEQQEEEGPHLGSRVTQQQQLTEAQMQQVHGNQQHQQMMASFQQQQQQLNQQMQQQQHFQLQQHQQCQQQQQFLQRMHEEEQAHVAQVKNAFFESQPMMHHQAQAQPPSSDPFSFHRAHGGPAPSHPALHTSSPTSSGNAGAGMWKTWDRSGLPPPSPQRMQMHQQQYQQQTATSYMPQQAQVPSTAEIYEQLNQLRVQTMHQQQQQPPPAHPNPRHPLMIDPYQGGLPSNPNDNTPGTIGVPDVTLVGGAYRRQSFATIGSGQTTVGYSHGEPAAAGATPAAAALYASGTYSPATTMIPTSSSSRPISGRYSLASTPPMVAVEYRPADATAATATLQVQHFLAQQQQQQQHVRQMQMEIESQRSHLQQMFVLPAAAASTHQKKQQPLLPSSASSYQHPIQPLVNQMYPPGTERAVVRSIQQTTAALVHHQQQQQRPASSHPARSFPQSVPLEPRPAPSHLAPLHGWHGSGGSFVPTHTTSTLTTGVATGHGGVVPMPMAAASNASYPSSPACASMASARASQPKQPKRPDQKKSKGKKKSSAAAPSGAAAPGPAAAVPLSRSDPFTYQPHPLPLSDLPPSSPHAMLPVTPVPMSMAMEMPPMHRALSHTSGLHLSMMPPSAYRSPHVRSRAGSQTPENHMRPVSPPMLRTPRLSDAAMAILDHETRAPSRSMLLHPTLGMSPIGTPLPWQQSPSRPNSQLPHPRSHLHRLFRTITASDLGAGPGQTEQGGASLRAAGGAGGDYPNSPLASGQSSDTLLLRLCEEQRQKRVLEAEISTNSLMIQLQQAHAMVASASTASPSKAVPQVEVDAPVDGDLAFLGLVGESPRTQLRRFDAAMAHFHSHREALAAKVAHSATATATAE